VPDPAVDLLVAARVAVSATFALLAVIGAVRAPRSGRAGWWVAAAFGALALVSLAAWAPEAFGVELPKGLRKVTLLVLPAFPYLLLRFTASFRRLPRWLEVAAAAVLAIIMAATVTLPTIPDTGARPPWASAYIAALLLYWVLKIEREHV